MLNKKEIQIMRENAKVHKLVFEEIRKILKDGTTAVQVDKLCSKIAKEHNVLCGFKWVYNFPNNLCISVNDVVVHGRATKWLVFKNWDLATFDFWIKDKKVWINTDAAFSTIIGWKDKNPIWAKLIEANKKALYAWIAKAKAWNRVWDISHAIGYELHEKPYIPNYWKAWTGQKLKAWMTLAIEPILGETSGKIVDEWDWEIFIEDGSLWSQYEHTILITDGEPEIII